MEKKTGFSLMELVIVFIVVGILVAISIPALLDYLRDTKERNLSSQLLQALETAQTTATTQKEKVRVCKSNDQKTCSGEWKDGFIVESKNKIIFSFRNEKMEGHLLARFFPAGKDEIEFSPNVTKSQNGTFWYCAPNNHQPIWAVILNQTGRAKIVYPDKSGSIVDENSKQALTCNFV